MAGFHVFQDLFAQVDAILQNFVTSASAKAVAIVAPFVAAAFVIVLLWDAFNSIMGRGEEPISKLIMKCLFWSCILSAALTAGAYQSNIADMVRSMPNDVAAEMSPRGSPPFSRTLTRRPIKAMRSVHVKAQEVHCRVQA
ncbi:type IV secretion system protein, partial [Xanthomonas euvesicatoria]|uniref:type IV secretion system protein n=1 Tax=Xanthomonas euvesicatoria TaxID=456327 RepID=UPI001E436180